MTCHEIKWNGMDKIKCLSLKKKKKFNKQDEMDLNWHKL